MCLDCPGQDRGNHMGAQAKGEESCGANPHGVLGGDRMQASLALAAENLRIALAGRFNNHSQGTVAVLTSHEEIPW